MAKIVDKCIGTLLNTISALSMCCSFEKNALLPLRLSESAYVWIHKKTHWSSLPDKEVNDTVNSNLSTKKMEMERIEIKFLSSGN